MGFLQFDCKCDWHQNAPPRQMCVIQQSWISVVKDSSVFLSTFQNWVLGGLFTLCDSMKDHLLTTMLGLQQQKLLLYFLPLKKKVHFVFDVKLLLNYAWQSHEISHGLSSTFSQTRLEISSCYVQASWSNEQKCLLCQNLNWPKTGKSGQIS